MCHKAWEIKCKMKQDPHRDKMLLSCGKWRKTATLQENCPIKAFKASQIKKLQLPKLGEKIGLDSIITALKTDNKDSCETH